MPEVLDKKDLLKGGNFFKDNPDKVLGEAYETTGPFGKMLKYKGGIENLDRIKVPTRIFKREAEEGVTLSNITIDADQQPANAQFAQNVEKAIKQSKTDIAKKTIKKKRDLDDKEPPAEVELLSFEETFNANNPDISMDELRAFVWHKEQIEQRLSGKWYDLAGFTTYSAGDEIDVEDLIKKGVLAHYNGEAIPAYEYYAENVYERKQELDREREQIVKLYDEATYNAQEKKLDEIFDEVNKNRLRLTAEEGKRLIILPVSDFARSYKVKTTADGSSFKMEKVTARSKADFGDPDFAYEGSSKEEEEFKELTLQQAFLYWLRKNHNTIQFKRSATHYEITTYYIGKTPKPKAMEKEEWERVKSRAKAEGDRLFSEFLANEISQMDQDRIELDWNRQYNGYVSFNYDKIPVAMTTAADYMGPMEIRAEKREAVAFMMSEGSGCLGYDVGFGKTWATIFAIGQFMEAGWCKRPLIVVPNQTYRQWMAETKGILPHIHINDLFNLSADYIEEVTGPGGHVMPMEEGSITILTYEGFERVGFNDSTTDQLMGALYKILSQGEETKREQTAFQGKLEMLLGKGLKGTRLNIEDLGFDFLAIDEAHNMKKIFTRVASRKRKKGKAKQRDYEIQSGTPSARGLKAFMLAHYILQNNHQRNIMLLTATPFTNSPLEVFSILSLIAHSKLENSGLSNINDFFDNYVDVSTELVITAQLKPARRQVFLGWNNLRSLQQIIYRFINFKNADTKDKKGNKVNIVRPDKYVLPYTGRVVDGELISASEDEKVDTTLALYPQQKAMMQDIINYVEEKQDLSDICDLDMAANINGDVSAEQEDTTEEVELTEGNLSDKEKKGVRLIRGINYARNLALSPYLYACSGLGKPTYKEYIETSPKLTYVIECIKACKEYH